METIEFVVNIENTGLDSKDSTFKIILNSDKEIEGGKGNDTNKE